MPLLARNAIGFLIAVAIYAGGLPGAGYIFAILHLRWGELGVLLFFYCTFGIVGYFLFRGNSRAVLVLFAAIIGAVALNVLAPDPIVAPDRRQSLVSIVVSISFGILAAITTNVTGWVVEQITNNRSTQMIEEPKGSERLARRESTLVYRLGMCVGRRLRSSRREK